MCTHDLGQFIHTSIFLHPYIHTHIHTYKQTYIHTGLHRCAYPRQVRPMCTHDMGQAHRCRERKEWSKLRQRKRDWWDKTHGFGGSDAYRGARLYIYIYIYMRMYMCMCTYREEIRRTAFAYRGVKLYTSVCVCACILMCMHVYGHQVTHAYTK